MKRPGEVERLPGASEHKRDTKRPLILVVEENATCCELLCTALTLAGYRIMDVADGVTARRAIQQADDLPAVVILDLSVSVHAAVDLDDLRSAWQASPPVIVLTTSRSIYQQLIATEWVLLKPFHLRDLLRLVQEALYCHCKQKNGNAGTENLHTGNAFLS
jgi:DNA-binding response OmpR family regulator